MQKVLFIFDRQPNGGIHFQIFGDPFEMTRYFESQMDHMLKHFFDGFGQNKFMIPFDSKYIKIFC